MKPLIKWLFTDWYGEKPKGLMKGLNIMLIALEILLITYIILAL